MDPSVTNRMYQRRLFMTPEPISTFIITQLESSPCNVHHTRHPHLTDSHFVHNLKLHSNFENTLDTFMDDLESSLSYSRIMTLSTITL